MKQPLLEIKQISLSYEKGTNVLRDVSLTILEGECYGLVGESGSGKSSLAKVILGFEQPKEGDVFFNGNNLYSLTRKEMRTERQHVQAIFQNPAASLNPRRPVWKAVIEPLENFPEAVPKILAEASSKKEMAAQLFEWVGLPPNLLDLYPHQLSGGQKQRVAIARAIGLHPKLLICDEPTSSLDVSVQGQILNLLKTLRHQFSISCLFISHDITAIQFISDRIGVLKDGELLDEFMPVEIFNEERHSYTRRLAAVAKGE